MIDRIALSQFIRLDDGFMRRATRRSVAHRDGRRLGPAMSRPRCARGKLDPSARAETPDRRFDALTGSPAATRSCQRA